MATIVEKEVALEAVIETLALVQRKIEADRNKGFPEIEEKLLDTREYLYFTDHKNIDSNAIMSMSQINPSSGIPMKLDKLPYLQSRRIF